MEIYATSIDYDPRAESSILFFKQVQNKMHWAAIIAMKHSKKISENLKECFWYNGDKKENLITDFFRCSKN